MKLIYVLGLEHSGTTLIDHLLSGAQGVVGLGEVANYFSASHMQHYHQRWGDHSNAYLCSCGKPQDSCELWSQLSDYSGLGALADAPLSAKYLELVKQAKRLKGEGTTLIDSSKSIHGLQNWLASRSKLGLKKSDIRLVLAIKDARSFVTSMLRKQPMKTSIVDVIHHYNYWLGVNRRLFKLGQESGLSFRVALYEQLCFDLQATITSLSEGFVNQEQLTTEIDHHHSHILIGNKDFILRNRQRVRYDDSWRSNSKVKCLYHVHRPVKRMNNSIYSDLGFHHFFNDQ